MGWRGGARVRETGGGWGGDSYSKATEASTREEAVESRKGDDVTKRKQRCRVRSTGVMESHWSG